MSLSQEQVNEALEQVLVDCEIRMAGYEGTSLRGSLYRLGYEQEDADQVVDFCYEGGFQYCLDPSKSATHFDPDRPGRKPGDSDMVTDYPSEQACYWGPDQLADRIECLSNFTSKRRHSR